MLEASQSMTCWNVWMELKESHLTTGTAASRTRHGQKLNICCRFLVFWATWFLAKSWMMAFSWLHYGVQWNIENAVLNHVHCYFQLVISHWKVLACPQAKICQCKGIYQFKQCPALPAPETYFQMPSSLYSVAFHLK